MCIGRKVGRCAERPPPPPLPPVGWVVLVVLPAPPSPPGLWTHAVRADCWPLEEWGGWGGEQGVLHAMHVRPVWPCWVVRALGVPEVEYSIWGCIIWRPEDFGSGGR